MIYLSVWLQNLPPDQPRSRCQRSGEHIPLKRCDRCVRRSCEPSCFCFPVLFLIPICRLLSLTSHRDSLVHRSVRHLLFAEGSRQDRRCRPPAGGEAANPGAKQTPAGAETTFDLCAEWPRCHYFKLGAFDSFAAPQWNSSVWFFFPLVISDDCGGEQTGNVHRH